MRRARLRPGAIGITGKLLIVANLIPIYGVLVHDWAIFPLILLYWLENLWLGVLQMVRLILLPTLEGLSAGKMLAGKLFLVPFFAVHYGMFCMIHGVFVFAIFRGDDGGFGSSFFPTLSAVIEAVERYKLQTALLALGLSHLISLLRHVFFAREQDAPGIGPAMVFGGIYARIVVLHVAILFGSFFVMAFGSPMFALILLIALKTAIDYAAHRKQHEKAAALLEDRRLSEPQSGA
jgi:uncharacterized protein DUF6498